MPDWEIYKEAYNRGILPPDKLSLYEEAMTRGLVPKEIPGAKQETISADPRKLSLSTQEKVQSFVRPLLEIGGMAAGTAVGAPLAAIPGPGTAGAALLTGGGYAAGKRAADIFGEKVLGIPGPRRTLASEAKEVPVDVLSGGTMELGGQLLGKGVQAAGKTMIAPYRGMTEESRGVVEIAKKHDVPLTPAEITRSRPLALTESALSFTPGSSGVMQRARFKQLERMTELREDLLNTISQGRTSPRSLEQSGLDLKNAIDEFVSGVKVKSMGQSTKLKNDLLKSVGSTETYDSLGMSGQQLLATRSQAFSEQGGAYYQHVWDKLPPSDKIPLPRMKETAIRLYKAELDKPVSLRNKPVMSTLSDVADLKAGGVEGLEAFAPEIRKQIEAQLETSGALSYPAKAIQGMRSELTHRFVAADAAYKTQVKGAQKMLSSPEAGVYKQLRSALEGDLDAYFRETGNAEAKKSWEFAQAFWGAGKQLFGDQTIQKAMRTNPENVIDVVFTPGAITPLNKLKKAVGQEGFDKLTTGFTNKIFDKASRGGFSWEKVAEELDRYGNQTLATIYSPAQLNQLKDVVSQGIKADNPLINEYMKKILRHSTPETILNVVFRPNNSEAVVQIKNAIPKEIFQDAKRNLTEKMLAVNDYGFYRPLKGSANYSKFDEGTLKAIYTPQESEFLREFMELSKRSLGADKIAGNPSGTAQSIITFESGRAVIRHPSTGIGYVLLPNMLARIYLSNFGRKAFTEGFILPGGIPSSANLFGKIMAIAGQDVEDLKKPRNEAETRKIVPAKAGIPRMQPNRAIPRKTELQE